RTGAGRVRARGRTDRLPGHGHGAEEQPGETALRVPPARPGSRCRHRTRVNEADEPAIRRLVQDWVVWRDAGDWDRFRTVWHDDGRMMATWIQGPAERFIEVSREGWNKGVSILHFLGGSSIDIAGARAIAQTKMTISQRAEIDGVA